MLVSLSIARVTARGILREKIFYSVAFFALVLLIIGILFGKGALFDPKRFVLDAGFASIYLFGAITSILFGSSLLQKELDGSTLYMILTKPVPRASFVVGKFLGLLCITFLLTLGFLVPFALIYGVIYQGSMDVEFFLMLVLCFFKFVLLGGMAMMFSTWTTPTQSAIFSVFLWMVATSLDSAYAFIQNVELSLVKILIPILCKVLPNFGIVSPKIEPIALFGLNVPVFSLSLLYLFLWTLGFLLLACVLFERREFK